MIKNIEKAKVIKFQEEVSYQKGQVVSKTLAQNKAVSLTLFSFDKGEEISSHSSSGDAMVQVIDGRAQITIDNEVYFLNKDETIIMPAGLPHALFAVEPFKMLLTVIFPKQDNHE